jgi:hypothetical protein
VRQRYTRFKKTDRCSYEWTSDSEEEIVTLLDAETGHRPMTGVVPGGKTSPV